MLQRFFKVCTLVLGIFLGGYSSLIWGMGIEEENNSRALLKSSSLVFGVLGTEGGNSVRARTSSLWVHASTGQEYRVILDGGTNFNNATKKHQLTCTKDPSFSLEYNIFKDSGRTMPWEQSIEKALPGKGTGDVQELILYGKVSIPTYAVPGLYIDTVSVAIRTNHGIVTSLLHVTADVIALPSAVKPDEIKLPLPDRI